MVKVKILIVDDEIDYCILMQSYFEDKNYEVFLAYTLAEGIGLMKIEKPDIIFLDNNLPDGEGWLKTDEIFSILPNVRLNLISGYKIPSDFKKENDNILIWEKPLSLEKLDKVFTNGYYATQ